MDFFELHDISYPVNDLALILSAVLHKPPPAKVDSACVAGLLDLLRTRGLWRASVRYGYVFGGLKKAGNLMELLDDSLWGNHHLNFVASLFEAEWTALLVTHNIAEVPPSPPRAMPVHADPVVPLTPLSTESVLPEVVLPPSAAPIPHDAVAIEMAARPSEEGSSPCSPDVSAHGGALRVRDLLMALEQRLVPLLVTHLEEGKWTLPVATSERQDAVRSLVVQAREAFINNNLLTAVRQLIAGAQGSFGLVCSSSLDAHRQVVLASRAQGVQAKRCAP